MKHWPVLLRKNLTARNRNKRSEQISMIWFILHFMLYSAEGTNCDVVGSLPFCGSSPSSCYARSQDFIRGINAGCWTGYKAICCDFKRKPLLVMSRLHFEVLAIFFQHKTHVLSIQVARLTAKPLIEKNMHNFLKKQSFSTE